MSSPAEISAAHRTAPVVGEILVLPVTTSSVAYRLSGIVGLTAVTAAGTNPPLVTAAGTPRSNTYEFQLSATTGGALGTAVVTWSVDDGSTVSGTIVTEVGVTEYVLGDTGVTVTLGDDTYTDDNVYDFDADPPLLYRGSPYDSAGYDTDRWFTMQADGCAVFYVFGGSDADIDETTDYTGTATEQCMRLADGTDAEYRLPVGLAEPVYIAVKGDDTGLLRMALTSPGRLR